MGPETPALFFPPPPHRFTFILSEKPDKSFKNALFWGFRYAIFKPKKPEMEGNIVKINEIKSKSRDLSFYGTAKVASKGGYI
jgi:hypothetical protein